MYILRTKNENQVICIDEHLQQYTIYMGGRKSSNDFRLGTGNFTHANLRIIGSTLHGIISS